MTAPQSARSMVTPMLLFSCFCLLTGDMLFGYDTGSFGGILGNPGFIRQFGSYHHDTESYAIDSLHTSLISSLAFIGKFIGCFCAGPAIEKYGHRVVFYALSVISILGVIIEITATDSGPGTGRFAQFVIGRIIVNTSVGMVEVDVTTYQSKIVPASFRGLVVVSLQLFLGAGGLVASGVNKAFETTTDGVGWNTVTGIQLVFPALILSFTPFIPSSPRWLLSKDRDEDAIASLRRLRPKEYAASGECEVELREIRDALHDEVHKASWSDLVRGHWTSLRVYLPNKILSAEWLRDQAYTYPIIGSVLGMVAMFPAMYLVDNLGRRYTLILSYAMQALWMYLLAGLGEHLQPPPVLKNTIVASFMLYMISYNASTFSTFINVLVGSYRLRNTITSSAAQQSHANYTIRSSRLRKFFRYSCRMPFLCNVGPTQYRLQISQ
ncbi:general substrate transporter [Aspergillus spectabilis]